MRVAIVHEIALVRNTLASALSEEPDIEVVGLMACAHEALTMLQRKPCDVLLIDASDLESDVLRFIQESTQQQEELKVVVMGVVKAEEFILQCFQAGAVGYVLRDDSLANLVQKIRAVHLGKTFLSPKIAAALVSRLAELSHYNGYGNHDGQDLALLSAELTPREHEVLRLLEQGKSNQEIADDLTIEVGTVKNHVHSILKKLNVDNRKRAAMLARQVLIQQDDEVDLNEPATNGQGSTAQGENGAVKYTNTPYHQDGMERSAL